MLDGELLRRFERRAGGRRLHEVGRSELGSVRSGGEQDVPSDLPGGVGDRPDPERRVERLRERLLACVDR